MPSEPIQEAQCAEAVMMIRPVRFHANPQTQESNAFQLRELPLTEAEQHSRALREFDALAATLRDSGVRVVVFDDTPEPHTPDSIFPNNWVTFHPDGRVVLYPMMAENRRTERRHDLIERLSAEHGFQVTEILDLSSHEADERFLEGTGSLVLDRIHRVAYVCRSPRTHPAVLADFAAALGYEVVAFDALGPDGTPIYHTNVMMNVGDGFAVVCAEAIADVAEREAVLDRLRRTGHEVVLISNEQMGRFAGNMLALQGGAGQVLAMSGRAAQSLSAPQREALERHVTIVAAPIPTIEDSAGGSVRCMLAEVFLPVG